MKKHDQYEIEVINSLKERISEEGGHNTFEINFKYKSPYGSRIYNFDLVEFNQKGEMLNVYVICSYDDYSGKLNYLLQQLRNIEKMTEAFVFLAYRDRLKNTQVVPLQKLELEPERFHTVTSFSDYYRIIKKGREDMNSDVKFFFRGQPNNMYEPIPSIYRGKNIEIEDRLYHEAIRRLPKEFTEDMSTFDKLVKMQHYELPTRLLDTTTNPLIALYFACQEAKNNRGKEADGEVLVYPVTDKNILYYDSRRVSVLANLSKCSIKYPSNLIDFVIKEGYTIDNEQLDIVKHQVYCVLPKLNNDRIIKQDGAFFIFGMGDSKYEPASPPELPYVIKIDSGSKHSILTELEFLGIHEASLFPETDKIMKKIKQQVWKEAMFCEFQRDSLNTNQHLMS